jgi:hypothetical protein
MKHLLFKCRYPVYVWEMSRSGLVSKILIFLRGWWAEVLMAPCDSMSQVPKKDNCFYCEIWSARNGRVSITSCLPTMIFSLIKEEEAMWAILGAIKTWKISCREIGLLVAYFGLGHILYHSLFLYQLKMQNLYPFKEMFNLTLYFIILSNQTLFSSIKIYGFRRKSWIYKEPYCLVGLSKLRLCSINSREP